MDNKPRRFVIAHLVLFFPVLVSSNDTSRHGGNGINILGKNVTSDMNLVTTSTYRIGLSHTKTDTVSVKQNNAETVDAKTRQTNAWVWFPSLAGIIVAIGSIFITAFILIMITFRNQNSHNEAPESRNFIV